MNRKFLTYSLNVLTALTIGGLLSTVVIRTARADNNTQKLYQFHEQHCKDPSKIKSKDTQRKCLEAEDQMTRDYASRLNANDYGQDGLRTHLQYLKQKFLELDKKTQELKKTNALLERKNKALKAQASQSCSVATQPQNEVKKSAGMGYVPVVGEFNGASDHEQSIVNEVAQ